MTRCNLKLNVSLQEFGNMKNLTAYTYPEKTEMLFSVAFLGEMTQSFLKLCNFIPKIKMYFSFPPKFDFL